MNRGQFGSVSVIHAFQSDHKCQAALKERVHKTGAGTGLNLTTIFESFLPPRSFWFQTHTRVLSMFALGPPAGQARQTNEWLDRK